MRSKAITSAALWLTLLATHAYAYDIMVSTNPDRSLPILLNGEDVAGSVYVFVAPEAGINQVRFYVDDPALAGPYVQLEKRSPYDLSGGSVDLANPYDTAQLSDGPHTISAALGLSSGSTVIIQADFNVNNNIPALVAVPDRTTFTLEPGGTDATNVVLSTSDATAVPYMVAENAGWCTVSWNSGVTTDTLTIAADAAGLQAGVYSQGVQFTADGYRAVTLSITLIVIDNAGGDHDILLSDSPDRSAPASLSGQNVAGDIYVFVAPDTGIALVEFYIDDPAMNGAPIQLEKKAPYDMQGGTVGAANPYHTLQLSDGSHTVTAAILLSTGTLDVTHADFNVNNFGPSLLFSMPAVSFSLEQDENDQAAVSLNTSDANPVTYALDGAATWLEITVGTGSTPDSLTLAVDSTGLAPGSYSVTVEASATGYAPSSLLVSLEVTALRLVFSPASVSLTVDMDDTGSTAVQLTASDGQAVAYSVSDGADWLTVVPTTGNTPETLSVNVNSTGLAPGSYTASAQADAEGYFPDTLSVSLMVRPPAGEYDLWVSSSSDRSNPIVMDGAVLSSFVYVYINPDEGVDKVSFFLDDPSMSSGAIKVEKNAPFDLAGTKFDGNAQPYDTSVLANGAHTMTAAIKLLSGETVIVRADFTTDNSGIPDFPAIDVWYGSTQNFGHTGQEQMWINVLGNVSDPSGVASLSYSLNNGPHVPLSVGKDFRRLHATGDFNVDIDRDNLLDGTNQLVITANANNGGQRSETVTVQYNSSSQWPLPTTVDWNSDPQVNNIGQVIDGKWAVTPNGVHVTEPGYDRMMGLGDLAWTDYEVLIPIIIHNVPGGNVKPGFGVILRWQGHSDDPIAGWQPKTGWRPLGALAWVKWNDPDNAVFEFFETAVEKNFTPAVETMYMFRMRVQSMPGQGGLYSAKLWRTDQNEPLLWDITHQKDSSDVTSGSVVLLAHLTDVCFGTVTVTPLGP